SASLSQCQALTVISRHHRKTSACRWTVEGIKDNWRCAVLNGESAVVFAAGYSPNAEPVEHGTVVLLERLDRLGTGSSKGDLDDFLAHTMADLDVRLGLTFHRFIGR